jgi:Zn-dependent peptidase ImmA (M78 family)/DNA-binding XRE family transcriptional regulator
VASGRLPALVTPALVRWARTTAGFDVATAAKRLKVAATAIEAWETGTKPPSLAQLRKMATLYKRPLAVFYLPESPQGFTPLRDFRTVDGKRRTLETPRLALGVPLAEQFAWTDQYVALNGWKRAVERAGVLVFHTENLPMGEARGFSLAHLPLPVVALNSKESPRGRIFTLMHELAHVALRSSSVCDLHDDAASTGEVDRIEVYCNRVAGALLVPRDSLADSLAALDLSAEREWADASLRLFADRYAISTDAALRALVQAGHYPAALYSARHAAFVKAWERDKPKGGPVPYFRRALGWSGRRFARLALGAYDEQRISSADLTEYLRVKMPQVEQIRSALRKEDLAESA